MDLTLAREMIENTMRMGIELHVLKHERDEIQQKYTALLAEHETLRKLFEMYCAEARREVDQKEFNIVEAITTPVNIVATEVVAPISENDDETRVVNEIVIDPLEEKKAKRKEYMRNYMRKKREEKAGK
jgi:hypothetical protein